MRTRADKALEASTGRKGIIPPTNKIAAKNNGQKSRESFFNSSSSLPFTSLGFYGDFKGHRLIMKGKKH